MGDLPARGRRRCARPAEHHGDQRGRPHHRAGPRRLLVTCSLARRELHARDGLPHDRRRPPGDRFGCRRLFLIGLAGFTVCSLADALAATPLELVAFRIGQGVFGGLLIPQGFVLLVRVIPRESMGMLFGLFGPLLAVSSISGPVVAGLLIELDPFGLSWRSVFLLNVLFGVLMLVAGLKVIPPFGGDASIRIRPGAAFTLMAGLGLLLAGMVDGGTSEWTARALVGTVAGAVALAAFAWQQARTSRPLLERSLFGNRGFVAGLVFGALFFGTVTGVMYVTAIYLQQRLGLSPFGAAMVTAPVSVGIIATNRMRR
ncbi:MFS transporter [Microbispora sp. CA-135349]|uniref:MFS transporter n=1 Tax=Microbispora sp. CA-135349 TaxID=3239953 RepID=UPI003D8C717D